jgi:hypothetical protein
MLSKCANPSCSNEFHYFGEGKVFEIRSERSSAATHGGRGKRHKSLEHYWLCSDCSSTLTIGMDSDRNVLVIPRPDDEDEKVKRAIA